VRDLFFHIEIMRFLNFSMSHVETFIFPFPPDLRKNYLKIDYVITD